MNGFMPSKPYLEIPEARKSTIIGILRVPEYAKAIKKYLKDEGAENPINKDILYEIVKTSYMEMYENTQDTYNARRFLSCLSKDIKGDKNAWLSECGLEMIERGTTSSGRVLYEIIKGA